MRDKKEINVFYSKDWSTGSAQDKVGYELLDTGEGEKLERFGSVVLSRPDPQALWKKGLSALEWKKASAEFSRDEDTAEWKVKNEIPKKF